MPVIGLLAIRVMTDDKVISVCINDSENEVVMDAACQLKLPRP